MSRPASHEEGYALVAALAAMALFAALSLALIQAAHVGLVQAGGLAARAQASAAADAGLALALHDLIDGDLRRQGLRDGRPLQVEFHEAHITIRLVDERGKVPINALDETLLTRVLERQGLTGRDLAVARDSLLDWLDDDDQARADGAEAPAYAASGIAPRNGPLWSAAELARVRGFGPVLAARLAPFITTDPDARTFDADHADPRALAALDENGGAVTALIRARELAGNQTALAPGDSAALAGRPFTVIIDADVPGGHAHREAVVERVGGTIHPWRVRAWN
ncbi:MULTISPECIES: type II secretion system protein GspK [unclassified Sphingomonas]|uniref:type II secretion system protein GspK n=1 Tax=Novosphingobium rhizosphaerae TaxID=1551649 RepID=UPI0015CCA9A8